MKQNKSHRVPNPDRDDLTNAPCARPIEIPPWILSLEMLSLFPLFSDRPLEKASAQDLELPPAPRALAWAGIFTEDLLTRDIWEGVDIGAGERGVVGFQQLRPRSQCEFWRDYW